VGSQLQTTSRKERGKKDMRLYSIDRDITIFDIFAVPPTDTPTDTNRYPVCNFLGAGQAIPNVELTMLNFDR